jgi:hypothetical protein
VGVVARKFARSRFVSSESTTRLGTVGRENCVRMPRWFSPLSARPRVASGQG